MSIIDIIARECGKETSSSAMHFLGAECAAGRNQDHARHADAQFEAILAGYRLGSIVHLICRNNTTYAATALSTAHCAVIPLAPIRQSWGQPLENTMTLTSKVRAVRRIVTGVNSQGRSCIVSDGPTPNFGKSPVGPLYLHTPWATGEAAVGSDEPAPDEHHFGFSSGGGSILRIIDYPPDELVDGAMLREYNHTQGVADPGEPRHYGFHKVNALEYAIILDGEIWALLDEGETLMKRGDVLIQRATNHSWSNRSAGICRVAFVVIDDGAL